MLDLGRRNKGEKEKTKREKKIIGNLDRSQKFPKNILLDEVIENGEK